MSARILIIDDDELILDSFEMIFSDLGFSVSMASSGEKGIEIASKEDFDLILSDIRMPGLNGAQTIQSIKQMKPQAKIMVLTAFPADPYVQLALEAGAVGVMKKPFEVAKILDLLKV